MAAASIEVSDGQMELETSFLDEALSELLADDALLVMAKGLGLDSLLCRRAASRGPNPSSRRASFSSSLLALRVSLAAWRCAQTRRAALYSTPPRLPPQHQ